MKQIKSKDKIIIIEGCNHCSFGCLIGNDDISKCDILKTETLLNFKLNGFLNPNCPLEDLQEENQEFEILSCPDCGSVNVKIFKKIYTDPPFTIECTSCCYGHDGQNLKEVIESWNGTNRKKIMVKVEIKQENISDV